MKALRDIMGVLSLSMLLSGCTPGRWAMEQSANYRGERDSVRKIVFIDPVVKVFSESGYNAEDFSDSKTMRDFLLAKLPKIARRASYNLEVYDHEAISAEQVDFLNELVPLHKEILSANISQQSDIDAQFLRSHSNISRTAFVYSPKLSPEWSYLSGRYNTPYFATLGLFIGKNESIMYLILVNTDTAETIYRDVRSMKFSVGKKGVLDLLYQTFKMMKKN